SGTSVKRVSKRNERSEPQFDGHEMAMFVRTTRKHAFDSNQRPRFEIRNGLRQGDRRRRGKNRFLENYYADCLISS
ncbi:hypothetical protein L9G74_20420, partial [Shewanella sp. C32]